MSSTGFDLKGHSKLNRGIVAICEFLPYLQDYRKKLSEDTFRDKLEIISIRMGLKSNLISLRFPSHIKNRSST